MTSIDSTFNVPPFPAFPSVTRYVPIGSLDEALLRVGRSIETREAISLIIGPPGTGKSLACQLLTKRFGKTHDVVVLGDTPIEDRSALLRHLLHHLGVDHVAGPANDLHLALVDRVSSGDNSGMLIVVDEAQALSVDVMEAIRMTTNIMKDGEPRVTAIICGGPKLDELLVSPAMEAFTQRVATRCYLHPMSGDETNQYISHVIAACGADPSTTITADALSAIHHGCNGVPRLINQLMTQAIDVAEERDQALIDEKIVDHAWAMLQQLPSPMIEEPTISRPGRSSDAPSSSIEFGELSAWSDAETDAGPASVADREGDHASTNQSTAIQSTVEMEIELAGPEWVREGNEETFEQEEVSAHPIRLLTPDSAELFGEFEAEEELSVGAANVAGRQDLNAEPFEVLGGCGGDADPSEASCEASSSASLESMLHQEIIGMSTMDESASVIADHHFEVSSEVAIETEPFGESVAPLQMKAIEETPPEPEASWIDAEDETIELVDDREGEDVNEPAIRFVEDTNQRPLAEPFHNGPSRDDSDLLVIEDELELRIASERDRQTISILEAEENTQAKSVNVDFQAMLSKMRTGS